MHREKQGISPKSILFRPALDLRISGLVHHEVINLFLTSVGLVVAMILS